MVKSNDASQRLDEFNKQFGIVGTIMRPPQNVATEELIRKTSETIEKLQRRLQEVFNVSKEKDEQIFIAWHIGELQRLDIELKTNKYAIYKAFPFVAALGQAIKVYEEAFCLGEYADKNPS